MWLVALLACEDEEIPPPLFDAERLDAELADYTLWEQVAPWEGVLSSCEAAHGAYVQVWLNDIARQDLTEGATTFSEGAIWVKEGYQDVGITSKGVDAMRKVEGWDPDAGDWFWGHYDDEGEPVIAGHVTGCVPCHAEGEDFVRTPTSGNGSRCT
jgi:hypothetical protein